MTPEQHLDDIEMIMGGRNGPSIQLRAQISDLQKQLAAAKEDADGLISNAITLELGEGWTVVQLKGRLLRKVYPDGVEVISLDGIDVVELHPVRFERVTEGGSIKIKAVQSYRILRPNVQVEGAEGCLQPQAPARTQGSA